ncbi:MAG: hypothetical protein V3T96_01795 [Thermodesulfobacteriota bacterium]
MRLETCNLRLETCNLRLETCIRPYLLAIVIIIFTLSSYPVPSVSANESEKRSYKTQYATIYYTQEDELYSFAKRITASRSPTTTYKRNQVFIKNKIDRIVYRVKVILDMHPADFHFSIYLYNTYRDLQEVYRGMDVMGKMPIAFYSHRLKAIYISLENLNDGVFAHEVAHAVINAYFGTPPPLRMQEILAQYVDKHLLGQ